MPPTKSKPAVKRQQSQLEKDEQVRFKLHAIVICDVEPNSLESATDIHPILLPLAGTPLLGYTLEYLEQGGVEEVVLISSRASQIQKYIDSSRWGDKDPLVKTSVVAAPMARSVGDFMREIDRRGLAKDDFVLVRGAVLSNVPLTDMVEFHRAQKEVVKDLMLLTMLLMETPSQKAFDSRRNVEETRVHVFEEKHVDDGFYRCLLSESIDVYSEEKQPLSIPTEITTKHTNFILRNDLFDCNIDICTQEVPALFTENFDIDDLRNTFVNDVLTSDLLSKHIYAYTPNTGYSSNISSLDEFWRVSIDMAQGLTSPFDPLLNIETDQSFLKKGSIWREKGVKVHETAQLTNVILGSGTTVGEDAVITNCVIGRNSVISSGVRIEDSVLLSNVTVNKSCSIYQSVLFCNELPEGSHLAAKSVFAGNTKLSSPITTKESSTFTFYGSEGKAIAKDEGGTDLPPIDTLNLTDSSISEIGSDTDSEDEGLRRRRRSLASSAQSDNLNNEEFQTEAEDSLNRAFTENHSVENAAIELKTLRMATNVTFREIREAIVAALMRVVVSAPATVRKEFEKWGELLDKFTEDDEARLDIVFLVQRYFARAGLVGKEKAFVRGLQELYQVDVLDEDVIFTWFEDERSKGVGEKWSEEMATLRKAAEKLVIWLREAEEESD